MEQGGVEYRVIQSLETGNWRWVALFKDRKEKSGSSQTRSVAIFNAIKAIKDHQLKSALRLSSL